MRRAFGVIVLTIALANCSSDDADESAGRATCDELADEAVQISDRQDVQLLKVRDPEVEMDKQEVGWDEPTGSDEVVILRCLGAGVWSDGTDTNVRLELSVDADGDAFVRYQPTH